VTFTNKSCEAFTDSEKLIMKDKAADVCSGERQADFMEKMKDK
jgi:hypothetical protein